MDAPRAVRIARPAAPRVEPVAAASAGSSGASPSGAEGSVEVRPNRDGRQRGVRLLLAFLAALVVIYAVFVVLVASSPAPGARSDPVLYASLTGVMIVFGTVGWQITEARAPRSVTIAGPELRVIESSGHTRRFPRDATLRVATAHRYSAGLFASGPTELVEVAAAGTVRRVYLVDHGLLDGALPPPPVPSVTPPAESLVLTEPAALLR